MSIALHKETYKPRKIERAGQEQRPVEEIQMGLELLCIVYAAPAALMNIWEGLRTGEVGVMQTESFYYPTFA